MKPVIKLQSAQKVYRYFGLDLRLFPVVELAIRNEDNRINFFDDELFVLRTKTGEAKTFNWNTDPSVYFKNGQAKAILRTGLHFYKLSYHHIGDNSKRTVGLRPNTPNAELKVWRKRRDGSLYESIGVAINQHGGGYLTTGSEGCQTAPHKRGDRNSQWSQAISFIGAALGYKVPLGTVAKADARLFKGIGNIPYILVTQQQFDYILRLDETEFQSAADLRFRQANFCNMPTVEKVLPKTSPVENAEEILADEVFHQKLPATAEAGDGANDPAEGLTASVFEENFSELPVPDPSDAPDDAKESGAGGGKTQTAEVIANVGGEKSDEALLDAAKDLPTTEIERTQPTGFGSKIVGVVLSILTGQFFLPEFLTNGLQANFGTILKFLAGLFRAAYENRYLIIGLLIAWIVVKKVNNYLITAKLAEINSDPKLGKVVLIEPKQRKTNSFFPRIYDYFFGRESGKRE